MKMAGGIPRLEETLARPNHRQGVAKAPIATMKGVRRGSQMPAPPEHWGSFALQFWVALGESGQSDFYEPSDWAFAMTILDDLDWYKKATYQNGDSKRSPEMLKALLSGLASLLVSEGDRRRVRVELGEAPEEKPDAAVLAIASYRDAEEDDD